MTEARLDLALYHDGANDAPVKAYDFAVRMMSALPLKVEVIKIDMLLGSKHGERSWYIKEIDWAKLLGYCKTILQLQVVRICVKVYDHSYDYVDCGGLYLYKICQHELKWLGPTPYGKYFYYEF